MPWVKIDEAMTEHPKVVGLAPIAFRALIESWCYSARNLTDGRVPGAVARRWANATCARQLVDAGLWERDATDYLVHDYLEYNPSRAEVLAQREQLHASRSAGGRARSRDAQRDGGRFTSKPPAGEPASPPADDQHNTSSDPTPTRTDPIPTPEIQTPPTPRKRGPREHLPVDEPFIVDLIAEFADVFSDSEVRRLVAKALNHKASDRWKDKRRGVRDWLTGDAVKARAERAPTPIRAAYLVRNDVIGERFAACGVDGCDHSNLRGSWLCMVRSAE